MAMCLGYASLCDVFRPRLKAWRRSRWFSLLTFISIEHMRCDINLWAGRLIMAQRGKLPWVEWIFPWKILTEFTISHSEYFKRHRCGFIFLQLLSGPFLLDRDFYLSTENYLTVGGWQRSGRFKNMLRHSGKNLKMVQGSRLRIHRRYVKLLLVIKRSKL